MADRPENGEVALEGTAHTATFSRNGTGRTINMGSPSDATDSTLTATLEDGQQVATRAYAGDSGFNVDTREDGSVSVIDNVAILTSASDRSVAYFADPDSAGYDHLGYGAWVEVGNTSGAVGAGTYGASTPANEMPTSGSATYTGEGVGVADLNDGGLHVTEFDVTVSTSDFSTVSINSSNMISLNATCSGGGVRNSDLEFSGTGTIDGSSINANLTSTAGNGTATGSFYGPDANEVGATFALDGSGGTHIGSFGASR